ncbi:MAG TPA: pyridoxal phosphate-dependent aminotransferase [Candidatus Thermoplasmatota archaeon]|nr:pyridoxal phosphate-dependent aminotransferase [Candidatus Thermoplasmatota archaeon]
MPVKVAQRLSRVKESGTVKITDAVAKLRKEGRDIISWSVGEPDFDTPKPVVESGKKALDNGKTHYVSAWGTPELREAIAQKHRKENGMPCEAKDVMVTPAKQGMFYVIMGLIDHGDEVLLPDPGWVSYEQVINLAGGKTTYVPATLETDFRMTPEAVAERITPKTKMLILNSPSNPAGGVQTREDMKAFVDLARDHNLWLFSDELYEKILYEGEHVSPASLPGGWERTITLNGLSKSHAMTGWRMGWLVAPHELQKELIKLQQHSLTHPAAFTMDAAVTALQMGDAPVKEMVAEFRARRDIIVKGLRDIPGFRLNEPKGAFYVFPRFDFDMTSMQFAEHLLYKAGVATTPGVEFGPRGEGHLRISYATSRENLRKGLERVAASVKDLPRRK